MKHVKLFFALFAMLALGVGNAWGAALGSGYEKVTNISSLTTGDKVVLYCDDASVGVTGWGGGSDATVAASGFVEYLVTVVSGGVTLKDESAGQYIAQPTGNHFKYNATAGTCSVNASGVIACNSRYLYQNGTYYRMYTDKSTNNTYKPFYVYKVVADTGGDETEDLGDALKWSAASATVQVGADNNEYPTLTNDKNVAVTYSSSSTEVATIDANGVVTLVKEGTTTISAFYEGGEIEGVTYAAKTVSYTLTVKPAPLVIEPIEGGIIDILTHQTFAATSSAYTDFTNKQAANENHSDAVYAGRSSRNGNSTQYTVQLTTIDKGRIATTTSGGLAKRVYVRWATQGTLNTNNRSLYIYGSNTAFTGSETEAPSTQIGTITFTTGAAEAYVDLEGDYKHILITGSGAIYMDEIQVTWVNGGTIDPVEPVVPENLGAKTIVEFLEMKNTTDTCVLTGVVENIANTTYGNFDLVDATGSVYVYGLLTAAGESQKFESMDIAAGDTLTVKAIYNEYNGNPQAKNAIYVSHTKTATPVVPENLGAKTIAEFLEMKNTTDTCVLTGVVANIVNTTYGNFDLVDATGSVYVYGLLTAAGESQKFASMDIAAGDTLTVKAIYNEYKGTPQAKNAIYVSHSKLVLTVKVTSENGTVQGLADGGKYVRGQEATLTATPAEGYEFVNWTVGEDVVAETAEYTFTVTADVALVANFEVALPGTVALSCTGMNKMYMAMRDMLQLEGTSADDKDVTVAIYNYIATVGDYQAFITFGDLELETESLKITRGSDEWTLAATIDADTAIYEFTATTAAPKTETIAPHAATWGGDAMNGYIIDCTTTSGTVQIALMDGTAYGMGWMLNMAINDALVVDGATIDAPTWEEDNLVLDVTVVSSTLDEYTIQLTANPKPAIEVIANATMALSEDEYEVGTMIVSATWEEHPLTVKLNGWPYYGYGEYAEANLVIEIDPENYDVVDAYSTAKLEKKEDVAVLTGTFSDWDGNKYALTLTIAEPAAAPVVDTVTVVCTDMVQGEEWGTPVLTGTCDLGDINISLNLEDTDHPESVYGEYGFAEYLSGLFPAVEVTIEGEDSFIMLELMENTVAVYTDGETQDSFVGTFLGSDWKVYVLDMKTPAPENPSALDNVTTTVAPIKMIENGQLMIIQNGVQYNAQGAVVK